MNFPFRNTLAVLVVFMLTSCATALQPNAEKIQIVTASQKEHLCQSLGIFSTEQRTGSNKSGNAMNKALNEVANKGGNGIFIVSSNIDWAEGASVTAEALKCNF